MPKTPPIVLFYGLAGLIPFAAPPCRHRSPHPALQG